MRPGPRRSLTHAEILDAAFDLLEAKGFEAVSVRGVAGSLGITPTALYTYYPSKNALLRGMVEHLLARLDVGETADPAPAPTPAQERPTSPTRPWSRRRVPASCASPSRSANCSRDTRAPSGSS